MNKRIIICGPAASGKSILKQRFGERGFLLDVSYTSRPPRKGEVEGIDYYFISEEDFKQRINNGMFYEWCQHGDYYYGTGQFEWEECDVFIMETHGISKITIEDRLNCFIIYLNPPSIIREERLRRERKWDVENIEHRTTMDSEKFADFVDYDIEITDPYF